jgi:ribosomal protein L21E
MPKRKGGFRRGTRQKFGKAAGTHGKISIKYFLQSFEPAERVYLSVEPAVHKGMYLPRFLGRAGIIEKKIGTCYQVRINDMGKEKLLIVHPVHLRKAEIQAPAE